LWFSKIAWNIPIAFMQTIGARPEMLDCLFIILYYYWCC